MVVGSRKLLFLALWICQQENLIAAVEKTLVNSHRPLQVLSFDNPPFTNSNKDGIDMMIVQLIADKLNVSIRLSSINSLDYVSIENIKYVPTNYR